MSYFGSPLYFGPFGAVASAAVSIPAPQGETLLDEVFSIVEPAMKRLWDIRTFDTVADAGTSECVIIAKTGESVLRGGDWYNEEKITIRLTGCSIDPRRAEDIEESAFRALLDSPMLSVSTDLGTSKEYQDDSGGEGVPGMFFVSHTLEVRL